jgi:ABC-2 type transport system permease protein
VAGKFLASLGLLSLCLLFTIGVPLTVGGFGDLDWGPVIGGYLGALFMGGTCIAIGMFLSSFTKDQIVSYLVSVIVLFALMLVGMPFIQAEFAPGSTFGAICRSISPITHFESIGRGVIDLRDLYYFVAVAGLFLYLNTRVLETRRRA